MVDHWKPHAGGIAVVNSTINDVLHYSYDPGCPRGGLPDVVADAAERPHTGDTETLARTAVDAFREAVAAELEEVADGATHVVPVSAGLDSRAILATLLEHPDVDPSSVRTVTYGTPGTWDFEIGRRLAGVAGVDHTAIDLTENGVDWSESALREYAASRDCPGGLFDGYANTLVSTVAPADGVVWVGFLGDVTAGGHQPTDPCEEWADACAYFAEREQYATGLTAPDYDPRSTLPDEPFVSRGRLCYEEQLDFALRQQCAIGPIVVGGDDYRVPFAQPAWLRCMLNVPAEHRQGRSLFAEAFSNAFPELFALPTDAKAGLPVSAGEARPKLRRARLLVQRKVSSLVGQDFTHPATNYMDFESAFRSGPLRETARTLTADFAERDVADWIEPRALFEEHRNGVDRTRELQVVCEAELYLSESSEQTVAEAR